MSASVSVWYVETEVYKMLEDGEEEEEGKTAVGFVLFCCCVDCWLLFGRKEKVFVLSKQAVTKKMSFPTTDAGQRIQSRD